VGKRARRSNNDRKNKDIWLIGWIGRLYQAITANTRYRYGADEAPSAGFDVPHWPEVQATSWRVAYAAKHYVANAADDLILP
jgi:hypothetical protein